MSDERTADDLSRSELDSEDQGSSPVDGPMTATLEPEDDAAEATALEEAAPRDTEADPMAVAEAVIEDVAAEAEPTMDDAAAEAEAGVEAAPTDESGTEAAVEAEPEIGEPVMAEAGTDVWQPEVGSDPEADLGADREPEAEPEVPDGPDGAAVDAGEPAVAATAAEPQSVARLIARTVRGFGVRMAFTVPGESFLALLEGLTEEGIRVVSTRHEGGAAFMAEAYGQLTGRPALAIGTRAVGAANMAIGVHTARQNSTPMIAIAGQVVRRFRGREAFQEVDQVASFGRLAKWAAELSDRNAVPGALEELSRQLRNGRPGPVYLSVPEDLLDEMFAQPIEPPPFRPRSPDLDSTVVRRLLHMLAAARRPVILAGAGVLRARASADLVQLAEMLEIPVIASWRRPDVFPNDHRLYLGMAGHGAPATVRERLRSADFVLVLGSRLSEVTTYGYTLPPRGQAWAHVDLEPRTNVAGVPGPRLAMTADTRSFLRSAVERLRAGVLEANSVQERRAANVADRAAFEGATVVDNDEWDGPGVHPGRIVKQLGELLTPDTVVTTDAGNFGQWAARGLRFSRPGTFLGPTSGAMGYALPAAIAAALARPNRHTVALAGDGGFAMLMAELETAVRERARVIALVFDNQRYGTIRAWQERRGKARGLATDLGPIDFAAVARACGAHGVSVDHDEQFEPAMREALARPGPTVIHLALDRRWLSVDEVLEPES